LVAYNTVERAAQPGEEYVGHVYLRSTDDKPFDPNITLGLTTASSDDATLDDVQSTSPPLSTTWQLATVIVKIEKSGAQKIRFNIGWDSEGKSGRCFLMDDATLALSR
jgi:hypothetical protein